MPGKLLDSADVGSSSIDRPSQGKVSECGIIMSSTSTSMFDESNRMVQVEDSAAPPEDINTLRNGPGEAMVNTPNSFEVLQAVATTTASTTSTAISRPSSGKTSPCRNSSLGSLRGEVFLSQPRPPSETVSNRKMGSRRGMAALNVAGTRRSWLWPPVTMSQLPKPDDLDNKGTPSDVANESADALTPAPTSGPHLLRIYSDPSTASDGESAAMMSNSIAHPSHEDGGEASEVCAEAEISPSTPSSSSSSPSSGSTSTSPEREGFIRARDSIGVTVRRSVSRNSGGGEAGGDANSSKQSTALIGTSGAQRANKSTTTWTRRSWSISVPEKRASMPTVSHARGSSAMTFHESLMQPGVRETAVVANGTPSGGATTGSITDSRMKQQSRGWRVKAAEESPRAHGAGARRGILGGRSSSGSGSSSKETTNKSPGSMRVENKELRLSSRRLEKALALAKVSSTGPRNTKHLL